MTQPFSERSYIRTIQSLIDENANALGHFEDAVAMKMGEEFLVVNIDGWVASTDRPPGMCLRDCGFRAVANAISDVIVKGSIPEGMVISMSLDDTYQKNIEEIVQGFSDAASAFKVPYLGGDLNAANDLVIDVTVWGRTTQLNTRSGASPGERVFWLGPPMGSTAAALGILTQDWRGERERALQIMGRPQLFPEFVSFDVTSAIDCSDGLARSLYLLANASSVGIEIDGSIPVEGWIHKLAMENGKKYTDLIFYGGEELGIVFTCSDDSHLPERVVQLGKIVEGDRVTLDGEVLENRGWDHFSSTG